MSPRPSPFDVSQRSFHRSFVVRASDGYPFDVRVEGQPDGPRVLASHGNGLAIDAFAPFLLELGQRCQVVSFDMRGHGRNPPPTGVKDNWATFVADVDHLFKGIRTELGARDTWGAFHSLSSVATLIHASRHNEPWAGLVMFEPPLHPPIGEALTDSYLKLHRKLSAHAAARRDQFKSERELVSRFRRNDSFALLSDEALALLAHATLRPTADGSAFTLCCPRAFEAKTFDVSVLAEHYQRIIQIKVPTVIVTGTPADPEAPEQLMTSLARRLAKVGGFALRTVPAATHFMQMERPHASAQIVHDAIDAASNNTARPQSNES